MANELQTVLPPLLNTYVPDVQRNVAVGINNWIYAVTTTIGGRF